MESRRAMILVALVVAVMVCTASAATCKQYSGTQAGSRCNQPETCCTNGLWCDKGRCSARVVSEAEKLKACISFEPQAGNRCDVDNGLCCKQGLRCNVGRCSVQ